MANATVVTTSAGYDELADQLRIVSTRTLRGPSAAHLAPVIVADLRAGDLAAHRPADVPELAARLHAALPGMSPGEESAAPAAPHSWADALVRAAMELQRLAGSPAAFGRVLTDDPTAERATVAIAFDEEILAEEALRQAARILRDCLRGDDPEVDAIVTELTRRYNRARPGATSLVMIEAARRRGIPVRRDPDSSMVQLGLGHTQRRMKSTMTDLTSVIATTITSDKHWTKTVLKRVGLGIPEGETARTLEGALEVAEQIGFPLLLKPLDANNGRGISGRIDTMDGVRAAWPGAVAEHPTVVIERFAQGNDHRVVVVNKRVVACVERIPAHVVGDGRRSIRALAEEVNRDPNRSKTNPSASLAPLPLEALTEAYLARSGRTLDSVPDAGETVFLRATANISTGGTAIDRTDEIHPVNRALCELAAGAVGLDVAGLDVLTPDISVPFRENGAVIIEVNASPGIRMHTHPDNGVPRDVPGAILDMIYPPGTPTTIPVIAVTGSTGRTEATRLIAHLFRHAGRAVGSASAEGVYFREIQLFGGDHANPFGANVVLSHPEVDIAVLESGHGAIVGAGLGFDQCDVGVVLDVHEGDVGSGGVQTIAQLADAKAVIPSVVLPSGHAVLNADDPRVLAMRTRTPGHVALFSARPLGENATVTAHVANGHLVALIERHAAGDRIAIRQGATHLHVVALRELPMLAAGTAGALNAVLAAALVAHTQGMPAELIRAGLIDYR